MSCDRKFCVVVVGDEVLCGKRTDKHLPHVIETLQARGMRVASSKVAGDDRQRLVHELRMTRQDVLPVLCFGGIGATPDDQTRQAAAEAFGSRLVRHQDAVAMIEHQFGDDAYPNRVRMADLPEDCRLIPNPCNGIPGFILNDHHFFPGFPFMAWPMLEWVLDNYFPRVTPAEVEKSVRVLDARESELLTLMDELSVNHGEAKLFSLPHHADINSIELGFRGEQAAVELACADLVVVLTMRDLKYQILPEGVETTALRKNIV